MLYLALAAVIASGTSGTVAYLVGSIQGQANIEHAVLFVTIWNNSTADLSVQLLLNGQVRRSSLAIGAQRSVSVNESVSFTKPNVAYFEVRAVATSGLNDCRFVLVATPGTQWVGLSLGEGPPQATFLSPSSTNILYEYELDIGTVSRVEPLGVFQAMLINSTDGMVILPARDLAAGSLGSGGGVTLSFTDSNGDGKLGGGDLFTLEGVKGSNSYQITLTWKASGGHIASGNVSSAVSHPQVAFLTATTTSNPYENQLEIGSVSRADVLGSYQVVVMNTSTSSAIFPAADLAGGSLGTGGGVTLLFTDLNGDGKVGGGDFFILQGVKGTYSYQVMLLWKADGSTVVSGSVPA